MINFIKTPVNKSNLASNSSLNNQVMLDEQDLKYKQSQFWYLAAKTIDNSLGNVKSLLNKYGYNPLTKEEAITNITQIIGTNKWDPFLNEFADIMEFSLYGIRKPIKLDKNIQKENETMQILTPFVEESGWIEAIAGLVGSVTTASLNFASYQYNIRHYFNGCSLPK